MPNSNDSQHPDAAPFEFPEGSAGASASAAPSSIVVVPYTPFLGPVVVHEDEFDTEEFRGLMHGAVCSERLRWWRASEDPSYSFAKGMASTATGNDKFLREEVDVSNFRALVQGVTVRQVFSSQGLLEVGDLRITTMPDEIPLTDHDWVIPWGRNDFGGLPDARTVTGKELITRGATELAGAGTVSSSGASVTGSATTFLSTFLPGDIIKVLGEPLRVVTVDTDTALTVESTPAKTWAGAQYKKCVDKLRHFPARVIDRLFDASQSYLNGTHFSLSADEQTIQWASASASPAPGTAYSVTYSYYPKFLVREDLGYRRRVVQGVSVPQMVIARLIPSDMKA